MSAATRPPVVVVGAGLVGRGWAVVFARAGHEVRLVDTDPAVLTRVPAELAVMWAQVEDRPLPETVTTTTDLAAAVADAVHVQECVLEDPALKARVLGAVDAAAPAGAVIASSTSALVPSSFTAELPGRHRVLVAHPFNPPHLHTAVELVPAPWTDPAAVTATRALLEQAGMDPIELTHEVDGFVANRLQSALIHEAFRLLAEGVVGPGDLDRAVRGALAPRWLTLGVVGTIDLNAPGGLADYVQRYEAMYQRLAERQSDTVDWRAALDAGLLERVEAQLPRADLEARRAWRDAGLAALARFREEDARRRPWPPTDDGEALSTS
ncbi:3-hydroxyacyl-CoA dehydrogenase NAD-binding domain-containing protein [Lapillicoccus jejuensis]|uniref:3-hydroxyacyl-CoA dehydrogenase n=1 Tax=Lapillicoccus jejuensis TaxID=402171 RepID=A0A542DY12_9MICO|nr:3-hydroxyacyl-CoA dehydrogenase NAD-binding domain-containing protein [Lapillicoccus jejuensis]TQJ07966.1 3-hydroxyacyl-CoA dehydrogenase [Lapillicoccus jejuensis]